MKSLSTTPSRPRQAKRDKPPRFKQLPTNWWSALRAYLKRLKRTARQPSASGQTVVNHSLCQSAPMKTLHQKIYPKRQLWQRLRGPSVNNNSTLDPNIASSLAQPLVNSSLQFSPAAPAGSHSFAHRRLTMLSINHPNPKVSRISFRATGINSLLRSLKPLPLMIPTRAITCSFSTLLDSQHNQKQAALVYPLKQINYLPPLPLNQVIDSAVGMANPSPKEPSVTKTPLEQPTQERFQRINCEIQYLLKPPVIIQESRKRRSTHLLSDLAEPSKKRARLEFNSPPGETGTSLIEPETGNGDIYPFIEITNPSPKELTVKDTEPEKPAQKESQNKTFKTRPFFCQLLTFQQSRKRCHPSSDLELAEPPKKQALTSVTDPDEMGTPLIELKNMDEKGIKYDDYRVETTTEKTDSSTEKWSGSELSYSEPSETETASESDWCYKLVAYGYDPQRYPLLTQLPDDCDWGKNILRKLKPEDTFQLDREEKDILWGARHYPQLTEFFQIDPLTYQHPYLEQSINAYTTSSESLANSTWGDSSTFFSLIDSNLADWLFNRYS